MEHAAAIVLQCLRNVAGADNDKRQQAEAQLTAQSKAPGYSLLLCQFLLSPTLPLELRQLAGIILKKLIKEEWDKSLIVEDRQQLKLMLPNGLADSERKVTTVVGMAIGQISAFDYPEEWPTLVEDLLGLIQTHATTSPSTVYGCVTCLEVVIENAGDDVLAKLTALLVPAMMQMLQSDLFQVNIKRRCFRTLYCLFELASYVPARKNAIVQQLPTLSPFLISHAFLPYNVSNGFLMAEVLPILVLALQHWTKHAELLVTGTVPLMLDKLFNSCAEFLRQEVAQGSVAAWEEGYTTDGETVNPATLIAQTLELLEALLQCSKMKKKIDALIQPQGAALVRCLINYAMITNDMSTSWQEDVNEFVTQDECAEEGYSRIDCMLGSTASVRDLALTCLESICQRYRLEGVSVVMKVIDGCLQEAFQKRSANDPDWWKLREAALRTLAMVCNGSGKGLKQTTDLGALLDAILQVDVQDASTPPLLQARAMLAIVALLSHHKPSPATAEKLWSRICDNLAMPTSPATLQIACCKVLPRLWPLLPPPVVEGHVPGIIAALCRILAMVQEETLTLVLATLTGLLRQHPMANLHTLPGDILELWARHKSDPLAAQSIIELYSAICKNRHPGTDAQLQGTVLPALLNLMGQVHELPGLAESAVEVLTDIIKHSSDTCGKAAVQLSLGPITALMLDSEDHTLAQCGCSCLRAMVWRGREWLSSFEVEVPRHGKLDAISLLLSVVQALYSRDYGESQLALNFSSGLIGQILKDLGGALSTDIITRLLEAVLMKLTQVATKNSFLTQGLIMVFARLLHSHYSYAVDFLVTHNAGDHRALEYLLKLWLGQQGDFFGRVDRAVSLMALVRLLQEPPPVLQSVVVPIKSPNFKLGKTRSATSKSGKRAAEFVDVPALSAIFITLCKLYLKEQEEARLRAAKGDNEQEEDGKEGEEEDEDDDDDDDEEEEEEEPGTGVLSDLLDMADEEEEDEEEFYCTQEFTVPQVISTMTGALKAAVAAQDPQLLAPFFNEAEQGTLQQLLSA